MWAAPAAGESLAARSRQAVDHDMGADPTTIAELAKQFAVQREPTQEQPG